MTSTDQTAAIDTVLLAFAADPVARWTWPDPHQYVSSMPSLIRAFGGNAFAHGGAYCTDEYAGSCFSSKWRSTTREGLIGIFR
jgi:hypothetical protein